MGSVIRKCLEKPPVFGMLFINCYIEQGRKALFSDLSPIIIIEESYLQTFFIISDISVFIIAGNMHTNINAD